MLFIAFFLLFLFVYELIEKHELRRLLHGVQMTVAVEVKHSSEYTARHKFSLLRFFFIIHPPLSVSRLSVKPAEVFCVKSTVNGTRRLL